MFKDFLRSFDFLHKKREVSPQTVTKKDGSQADELSTWLLSDNPEDQEKAKAMLKLMDSKKSYLITCKVAEIKSLKQG